MKPEIYGTSRAMGKVNEDAYTIHRQGEIQIALLADGAGNAGQIAKKVLSDFQDFLRGATLEALQSFPTWASWIGTIDANMLGGETCTLTGLAVIDGRMLGVNVGDNRVYRIDLNGKVSILSQGSKERLGSGNVLPSPLFCQVQHGEVILLMTDGAWSPLSLYKIARVYRRRLLFPREQLAGLFIDAVGKLYDDATVICVYF